MSATARSESRIFYVLPHVQISGGCKVAFEQATHLVDRGYQVYVLTKEGQPPSWMTTQAEMGKKAHWDGQFDGQDILIFTWDYDVDYVVRQSARKFYLVQHFVHPLVQILQLPLDGFIAVSKYVQRHTRSKYSVCSFLVPNGLNHDTFRAYPDVQRDPNLVVTMDWRGQACWKGFDDVERAIQLLQEVRPQTRLRMIEGLTPQGVARVYASAAVYVAGSWYEGFGLPLLEAMACGCAVVSTENKGSDEFAIDGQTCIKVPVRNPEALAKAIIRVLDDDNLRRRLVANGLQMAQRYAWEKSIDVLQYALGLTDELPNNELARLQPSKPAQSQESWDSLVVRGRVASLSEACRVYRTRQEERAAGRVLWNRVKRLGKRFLGKGAR